MLPYFFCNGYLLAIRLVTVQLASVETSDSTDLPTSRRDRRYPINSRALIISG